MYTMACLINFCKAFHTFLKVLIKLDIRLLKFILNNMVNL